MALLFKDPVSNKDSGVLAKLWRKVILESRLENSLNYLADRYVKRSEPMSSRVANVKRRTKSTVMKNITDGDMTIKTFLDLVFNLLGAKKLTISIKITYPNGTESVHSVPINNNELSEKDFVDDDVVSIKITHSNGMETEHEVPTINRELSEKEVVNSPVVKETKSKEGEE